MKKLFLSLFVFLFLISFVVAQPPFQVSPTLTEGYFIEIPEQGILKERENFTFFFHVFNISNGLPLSNVETSCEFNLHNSSSELIFIDTSLPFDSSTFAFTTTIMGGNFTNIGDYTYVTHCNSTNFGGVVSVKIAVTPTGELTNLVPFFIVLYLVLFGIIVFGFYTKIEWFAVLGGMGLMFMGIYTMNNGIIIFRNVATEFVSWLTIAFGAMAALIAAISVIEDNL